MKTTLILAIILTTGIFFQKKISQVEFKMPQFSNEEISHNYQLDADLNSEQIFRTSKNDISQQTIFVIFNVIKKIFFPLVGIVIMMWMMMAFGFFHNLKKTI